MTRGLLIALVTWVACAAAYWYFLHTRFPAPYDWIVPAGAGLVMSLAVGAFSAAMTSAGEARRVSAMSTSSGSIGEAPRDGESFIVVGSLRATGPELRAPFSGRASLLYDYDLQHLSRRARHDTMDTDYSGFAVTPCAIDTPQGSIRLLGFPLLEGFDKGRLKSDEAFRNAAAYLTATQFQDLSGFQPGAILRESKELMTADDGQLRRDWSMSGDSDLSGKQLFERSVAPGEMVCLIGCYSAERRGLAPNLNVGAVRLVRGDPQTASRAL